MQLSMGMQQDGEKDEFKRVLLEGNPYLLVGGIWSSRLVRKGGMKSLSKCCWQAIYTFRWVCAGQFSCAQMGT